MGSISPWFYSLKTLFLLSFHIDFVIGNADNLKELYSRAQGEVSIREALRELDLWGAGANFSLTGYTDSAAKELSIIKDWKELVNQVSVTVLGCVQSWN